MHESKEKDKNGLTKAGAGRVASPGLKRSGRVCVVDDDLFLLRALQRLLVASGFAVVEAFSSAEDFLASAQGRTADCLVLDVHLGGISGFDLCEALSASGTRIPVIFITAHDDTSTRERARRAGAAAYLSKPFDDQALIGAVCAAMGG